MRFISQLSWHVLMRMKSPRKGSGDSIELPPSLHAFRRASPSDQANMVIHSFLRTISFFSYYMIIQQMVLFYFYRKVTTHFVGDSGITLAWVRIFLIVIWNSLICFLYKSDLQHMFPWLVSVTNQFYCRDGCSNILWVSFSEKITSWKF